MATTARLNEAIRSEDDDTVSDLLERAELESLNASDWRGNTPLHAACRFTNQQALRKLLTIPGVNVNATNKWEETPLHVAVANRNHRAVEKLGKTHGVNVNAIDTWKGTPLHRAAQMDHNEEAAHKLLAVPGINVNLKDGNGKTPVMIAAIRSDREILEILVKDKRVDIDLKYDGKELEEMLPQTSLLFEENKKFQECYEVIQEGRRKRKVEQELTTHDGTKRRNMDQQLENDDGAKKRRMEQEEGKHYDKGEKVRCDPDEVRDNIRKDLIGKIDQVNEEKEVIKQTMNRNAEKMEREMKKLKEKQDLEGVYLDARLDEEKMKIDQEKMNLEIMWRNISRYFRRDKKEMLARHTEEKNALEEKYKDEESQQAIKDLTKTSNQLGDDLKKLDMDPNDIKKMEKARRILECPICFEIMLPPTRIWMCPSTHSLCEACKDHLEGNVCPTCRTEEVSIRALVVEEVARALFD